MNEERGRQTLRGLEDASAVCGNENEASFGGSGCSVRDSVGQPCIFLATIEERVFEAPNSPSISSRTITSF